LAALQVGILKVAPDRIVSGYGVEIGVEPKHVENGGVAADRRARATLLDPAQSHERHAGALRNEGRGKPTPAASAADALAELLQAALDAGEQGCGSPGHNSILALTIDNV
jgi:hypothetical protein